MRPSMPKSEPTMNANTTPKKNKHTGIGLTYLGLALLRILLVIVPQTGYIHPDEYFQSLEIVVGNDADLHQFSSPYRL